MSPEQRLEPAAAAQWSAQQLLGLTLPAVLLARVQRSAGSLAYRVKWRGLYRERSWLAPTVPAKPVCSIASAVFMRQLVVRF